MSELRTLATGIAFGESPRWHDGLLWFCDWGAGEVRTLDADGRGAVVARVPTAPLCIDFLPDGRLLAVAGGQARLLCRAPDGSLRPYAELGGLSRHPWNEVVADGRGNAFVNNIGFEFPGGEPSTGIIAVVTADGVARQVADGVEFPNGMALTPDGSTLIVAESYANRLTAFSVAPDGGLSDRRVWAGLGDGVPDGICLDAEGAVWYADVPGRCCVRVAEGGRVLQRIELDRGCFACALGGADGRTLFMVATEWSGAISTAGPGGRTGQVLATAAPAPGAGRGRGAGSR